MGDLTTNNKLIEHLTSGDALIYGIAFLILSSLIIIVQQIIAYRLKLQSQVAMINLTTAVQKNNESTTNGINKLSITIQNLVKSHSEWIDTVVKQHEKVIKEVAKIPKMADNNVGFDEAMQIIRKTFDVSRDEIIKEMENVIRNNNLSSTERISEVEIKTELFLKNLHTADVNMLSRLRYKNVPLSQPMSSEQWQTIYHILITNYISGKKKQSKISKIRETRNAIERQFTAFYVESETYFKKL